MRRAAGPVAAEAGRRSVAKWMRRHGVTVLESDVVAEVRAGAVVFADGAVRPSAVTIWTAGFGVPELAAASGLRTDALGRLLTDETLTSVDDGRIVAAGDCAAPSGQPLRMSCQAAGPLGTQAADTVLSRIAGEMPRCDRAEVRGHVHQPWPQGRRAAGLAQGRLADEGALQWSDGRVGEGSHLQGHAVGPAAGGAQAGFVALSSRATSVPCRALVRPGGHEPVTGSGHGRTQARRTASMPSGSPT